MAMVLPLTNAALRRWYLRIIMSQQLNSPCALVSAAMVWHTLGGAAVHLRDYGW